MKLFLNAFVIVEGTRYILRLTTVLSHQQILFNLDMPFVIVTSEKQFISHRLIAITNPLMCCLVSVSLQGKVVLVPAARLMSCSRT